MATEETGLGKRLRQRREELGLNQTDLGAIAQVHRATVRSWELGRSVEDKTQTSILRTLGCSAKLQVMGQIQLEGDDYPVNVPTVVPLLSAGVARILCHGVLRALREQPDSPAASTVREDYMELVAALDADDHELRRPASLSRLRDRLVVPAGELMVVDAELDRIFDEDRRTVQSRSEEGARERAADAWHRVRVLRKKVMLLADELSRVEGAVGAGSYNVAKTIALGLNPQHQRLEAQLTRAYDDLAEAMVELENAELELEASREAAKPTSPPTKQGTDHTGAGPGYLQIGPLAAAMREAAESMPSILGPEALSALAEPMRQMSASLGEAIAAALAHRGLLVPDVDLPTLGSVVQEAIEGTLKEDEGGNGS